MQHTAEIIAVGTELLLGHTINTDSAMIARALSALGIGVYHQTVVGDNPQRLLDAVNLAKSRADIIITTGGLGPTCDDLTKQVLARAFGKELVPHPASEARIRAYFERNHLPMSPNNLRQAMLPEGCTVLENDWGTAPGCAFEADGVHVIMLPGPPRECTPMMQERAVPYLAALSGGVILSRTLKVFGMGESAVEDRLHRQMSTMENPTLAPYAKEGEMEVRITARAADAAAANAMLDPVEAEVRAVLGDVIYGVDVPSLEARVLALLKEAGTTLATAESCTGGLIAKRITDLAGASAVFRGGVVSYTNEVKAAVLGVPEAMLAEYGAVSPQVAAAMAQGARERLGSSLAVSVTGVAGPDKDDRGNPVGLVYLGFTDGKRTWVKETHLGTARGRVRTMAAHTGLDLVRRYLTGLSLGAEQV